MGCSQLVIHSSTDPDFDDLPPNWQMKILSREHYHMQAQRTSVDPVVVDPFPKEGPSSVKGASPTDTNLTTEGADTQPTNNSIAEGTESPQKRQRTYTPVFKHLRRGVTPILEVE